MTIGAHTPNPDRDSANVLHDDIATVLNELQHVANRLGMGSARAPHLLIDGVPIRDLSNRAHRAMTNGWNALSAHIDRTAHRED